MKPVADDATRQTLTSDALSPPNKVISRVRVLILARYGTLGASSRVRHYAYIPALERRGFDFETHALIGNESLSRFYEGKIRRWDRIAKAYCDRAQFARQLARFDVIWIEKEAMPNLPWPFERLYYRRPAAITIVDMDDLWIERFTDRSMPKSNSLQILTETRKLNLLVGAADAVTVANKSLGSAIKSLSGREAIVQPNCIDVEDYAAAAEARDGFEFASSIVKPRIGWIGTPYTASQYLPPLVPLLNRISAAGIADIVLIGAGNAVSDLNATRMDWTFETEASAVASLDIGFMPLGTSGFDARKSGWKLYQYMSAGRPVVASRIGFNSELVEDGVSGFLVDNLEQFEIRLRELVINPDMCRRFGRAGQKCIRDKFNRNLGASTLETLFRSLLEKRNLERI